jgi:thioredoxin reductase (NADPH)
MITTDLCIIGAGPVGLFAVFEAGLLKMRCHVVDALPQVGGQLTEIYPRKPIYDIPGYPEVNAKELIEKLMKQAAPFHPTFTLGERVNAVRKKEEGGFEVVTTENTVIQCKAIVIAAGLGSFEPRKPTLDNLAKYEAKGKGVLYMVRDPELFRGKRVVLAGGGDSALDWTLFLANVVDHLTLVHRNETFRGAPDSGEKVFALAREKKIDLHMNSDLHAVHGDDHLEVVTILDKNQQEHSISTDYLIPLYGLSPKLGPISNWGLALEKNNVHVNTVDYSTSVPGIYAIGDINTYQGKLKLILSGFHEAALMAHSAFKYVYPDQKPSFKYTTVSGIHEF